MNVKDWDLAIPQVALAIAGIYYVYQGVVTLGNFHYDNLEAPASLISSILLGIILFGLAALLQEIRKYRNNKRSIQFA
jgi:uncharacterized membrane protein